MHLAIFQRLGCAIVLGLGLAACSGGGPQSAAATDDPAIVPAQPPARQKTFLDPQLQALDKARSVERLLKKDAANTAKAIDDSGG